jgi:sugar lactone lactonase YvrE
MTGNSGALALSPDEQTLYVVTGAGKLGVVNTADLEGLRVSRTADLGIALGETAHPVVAAGSDHLWISMHRQLLMVDPVSLEVQGRAELPAPVTALTLDPSTGELLAASDGQLRRWTVDGAGVVTATGELPLPDGLGVVARIAT